MDKFHEHFLVVITLRWKPYTTFDNKWNYYYYNYYIIMGLTFKLQIHSYSL